MATNSYFILPVYDNFHAARVKEISNFRPISLMYRWEVDPFFILIFGAIANKKLVVQPPAFIFLTAIVKYFNFAADRLILSFVLAPYD